MNLRNKKEPKKRGRPPNTYRLTAKGFIVATLLSNPNIGGEQLYDKLEAWAKKRLVADKDDGIPALVFVEGGVIVGVKKHES
jgi:predicted ArsR family transcriptional regulator